MITIGLNKYPLCKKTKSARPTTPRNFHLQTRSGWFVKEKSNSNKDITNVVINLICLCSIVFAFANYLFVSGIDTVLTMIIGFFIPEIFITIIVPAVYCKRHPKVLPFVLKKIRKIFKQEDQTLAVNVIGSNHGNPI